MIDDKLTQDQRIRLEAIAQANVTFANTRFSVDDAAGYDRAVATLRRISRQSGSPAATWAAEYLAADPDREAPQDQLLALAARYEAFIRGETP